jgi:hypothetical protein
MKRFVFAAALCVVPVTAHAAEKCWPIQWTYTGFIEGAPEYVAADVIYPGGHGPTVPPFTGGNVTLGGPLTDRSKVGSSTKFGWFSEQFPYKVPKGYRLALVEVHFSTKKLTLRSSYFGMDNIFYLSDWLGYLSFRVPHLIPEDEVIDAHFLNNSPEQQIVIARVAGCLIETDPSEHYSVTLMRVMEALR